MRVSKWGNSLAIRLPAAMVRALDLKAGDQLSVRVAADRHCSINPKADREELLARLRAFRGSLPADFRFNREEANAR